MINNGCQAGPTKKLGEHSDKFGQNLCRSFWLSSVKNWNDRHTNDGQTGNGQKTIWLANHHEWLWSKFVLNMLLNSFF